MPLTGLEVARLADALEANFDLQALNLLAADLGINADQVVVGGALKVQALALISHLNGLLPPRDRELLQMLRNHPNAAVKKVAADLLNPTFISPNGDPHEAVLLGRLAFIARHDLRNVIREFTAPSANSTRVLVVRGEHPGGKSYSFEFLRHLAFHAVQAQAVRVRTIGLATPVQLLRNALLQLGLSTASLPVLPDAPQIAREVDDLLPSFVGEILKLEKRFWLAIDDLNEQAVRPEIRETALAVAKTVEDLRAQNLWIALLGYNETIVDSELRHIAMDEAEFPSEQVAADFLDIVSRTSVLPLPAGRARQITRPLYGQYSNLDRAAMKKLTVELEKAADKLRQGIHP